MTEALPATTGERSEGRGLLSRFLIGSGVELGPGHHPFPLRFPGASVQFVDRWEPDQNRELFPELGGDAGFPKPHIVANLDTDRLSALPDQSQDFVIASHVLEHLADPLGQLAEIHRVLKPGGVVLVFLPDRRYSFDSTRVPTAVEHLIAEHAAGVTQVSEQHLEEFMRHTNTWDDTWTESQRQEHFELHRNRSIHVHCWAQDEFLTVIKHCVTAMAMTWELLDALFTEETLDGYEFGFALRRSTIVAPAKVMVDHLTTTWEALATAARTSREEAGDGAGLVAQRNHAVGLADEYLRRARVAEARLARLARLPGYGAASRLWRLQRRLRSNLSHR